MRSYKAGRHRWRGMLVDVVRVEPGAFVGDRTARDP